MTLDVLLMLPSQETGDEGEIWFGEGAVDKMVDWAYQYLPPFADGSGPSVMECGCGKPSWNLEIYVLTHLLIKLIFDSDPPCFTSS